MYFKIHLITAAGHQVSNVDNLCCFIIFVTVGEVSLLVIYKGRKAGKNPQNCYNDIALCIGARAKA